ncbi:hypothetical protein HK100_008003, partial [Physocladia obscura]
MRDFEEEEAEVALDAFDETCAALLNVNTAKYNGKPWCVLVVAVSSDAAKLLTQLSSAYPAQPATVAVLLEPTAKTERNGWGVFTAAGGVVVELSDNVLGLDLSATPLGPAYLDTLTTLFTLVGIPSDAVVVLDRKFSALAVSSLPALISSSATSRFASNSLILSKFPPFLPPNILTGWSAAFVTQCQANSIPCYCFIVQDSSANTFAESRVLELFNVHIPLSASVSSLKISNPSALKPEP